MVNINDPGMKEIIQEFCQESLDLCDQLQEILDSLEEDPTNKLAMEKFGQIIDRIMGAAKTIQADEIAIFSELGKAIGYKASQISEQALLEIVTAILFDSVDILVKLINGLKSGQTQELKRINTQAFVTRLNWLKEKFNHIERSSVAADTKKLDQNNIDQLLKDLGL